MRFTIYCLAALAATACFAQGGELRIVPDIEKRVAQFARLPLSADLTALSAEDRKVLDKLIQAAEYMDAIFLRQVWAGNPALAKELDGLKGKDAD
ncbi:MAG TPA: hypothetical protein VL025_20715, partial [Thermoanaerobaculia bacterium]|nr:hypothetical protein [Thermoanaerobaculia bacterium]